MAKLDKIAKELFILARDKEKVSRAKIVAAIVYKGKIISYGFNQPRTSWVARRFKKNPHAHYLHAEADAVKNALKVVDSNIISNSSIVIVRAKEINGKYQFGNSKPCSGCQSCLNWAGITKIYYSDDSGNIIKE